MSHKEGRELAPEYLWHKDHLRADAPDGCKPVKGFGPGGTYTLWLPSPVVSRARKFVDGKPVITEFGALCDDAELTRLRNQVIKTTRTEAHPVLRLFADVVLLEYSAGLILRCYDVTDDDLNMLHSGNAWIEPIAVHAIGGAEARDNWRRASAMTAQSDFAAESDSVIPLAGTELPASSVIFDDLLPPLAEPKSEPQGVDFD
jgi:hypothetical protein